jgi:CheY-like chemotaxis protein
MPLLPAAVGVMTSEFAAARADGGDLLSVLDATPVGILEMEADGRILLANPAALKLLLPLAGTASVGNLFDSLHAVAPWFREMIGAFALSAGSACKDLWISLPSDADGGALEVSITAFGMGDNRIVVTITELRDHGRGQRADAGEPVADRPAGSEVSAIEVRARAMALRDCVLIVDDEFLVAQGIAIQVEDMGLRVCAIAETAEDALSSALIHRPRLALIDVRLQGEHDGVDAAITIHREVGSKIIFITGSQEPDTLDRLSAIGAAEILFKPVSGRQLCEAVERSLRT